jgi:hypothetical protein
MSSKSSYVYIIVISKPYDGSNVKIVFYSYMYISEEMANKIQKYIVEFKDYEISFPDYNDDLNIRINIDDIKIISEKVKVEFLRELYGDSLYNCIDMIGYMIARIKINEMTAMMKTIIKSNYSNSDTKDLNFSVQKYYCSIVGKLTSGDKIFLRDTYKIIDDKKYDSFLSNFKNYVASIYIDNILKDLLIPDLWNIVKYYLNIDINKNAGLTKVKKDIFVPTTISKEIELEINVNSLTTEHYIDPKSNIVLKYFECIQNYAVICKYENEEVKKLSSTEMLVIKKTGIEVLDRISEIEGLKVKLKQEKEKIK